MSGLDGGQRARMREDGYVILEGALTEEECDRFSTVLDDLWWSEGLYRTHDFDENVQFVPNLLQYSREFERCVDHPSVLEAVQIALGDRIRLNRLQSRRVDPGGGHQPLHDLERSRGGPYFKANVIWCLDQFTTGNGATRVIPGSHAAGEPFLSRCVDPDEAHPDEVLALAPRGAAIVHNSHLLHGGTQNRSAAPRRSIHTAPTTWDIEPHWAFDNLPAATLESLSRVSLSLMFPPIEATGSA